MPRRRRTNPRRRRNAALGYRGSRGHRTRVNPRQLVNAKLARMPNGRYKIFLAPGAMAKMRLNPRVEQLRDGRVYVYMTNFGYYAEDSHSTLRAAIKWAQSRGFEAQFMRDGKDLGSWTPFGGVRLKRQYEHEYYG